MIKTKKYLHPALPAGSNHLTGFKSIKVLTIYRNLEVGFECRLNRGDKGYLAGVKKIWWVEN
jgi:hypothetical protein